MYTKEQFHRTISILVSAYINDTLTHGECKACAVGNLVSAGMGYTIYKSELGSVQWHEEPRAHWQNVICSFLGVDETAMIGKAKEEIESTGYTPYQLAAIEAAFESHLSADGFIGLMAVVDVLCDIHGMNETEKQESKALFVKV